LSKLSSIQEVAEWNSRWRFHSHVPLEERKIPTIHEWFYDWFFSVAVIDIPKAIEAFKVISEFLSISRSISLEEGYGILMVNLDAWYFRAGYQYREQEYRSFKSFLFLASPGAV